MLIDIIFYCLIANIGCQSRFFKKTLIEELHTGANILLAYFHYCNKGSHPFSEDWASPTAIARAKLNAEQASFMRSTAERIAKKGVSYKHCYGKARLITYVSANI